ncbi:MAG: SGNH/GDSL hydrolase family protein [Chlorobi bacterium]|nr:MAG: GDSL-like Lipase/Acylhydrolase [Chlorobi bacterium OLB7]MBK8910671.1 SGNH/GDSL hydrolase family protein [Chlorobiota bacterium]
MNDTIFAAARSAAVNKLRFLALGDSYTIGESVAAAERWPMQLAERLRAGGVSIADPQIIARTGWTTDELNAAIDEANPQGPFDLVTLLIGVNNQYRGRAAEEYRGEFVGLLNRAIAFAGGKPSCVIVLSIPDWGVTPFAQGRDRARIAEEIDLFNRIAQEEAEAAGARFVDITPESRKAATDPALTAADNLHPAGAMYSAWTTLVLPVAMGVCVR